MDLEDLYIQESIHVQNVSFLADRVAFVSDPRNMYTQAAS